MRGGPGAVVSGCVWLFAGVVATQFDISKGFGLLFFGGMLIFPMATLIVRGLFRRAPASQKNPGGTTVIETVFPMIAGLLAAWLLLPYRPEFVFPMASIAVGAHYFGFRTAYGDWSNWGLGGAMCAVGVSSIFLATPTASLVPYLIATIEIGFGVCLTAVSIREQK